MWMTPIWIWPHRSPSRIEVRMFCFINVQNIIWRTKVKSTDIHISVRLERGLSTILMKLKISCIRNFFSYPFDVPWGLLMQTYCDHSVTTQALQLKGTVLCIGLFIHNWSREFMVWRTVECQRSCDVTTRKWIYCYVIRMVYSCDKPCTCICHPYDLTRVDLSHYSDVIWAPSRLISPTTRLYVHVILLLENKGYPKATLTVRWKDMQRIPLFHDLSLNNGILTIITRELIEIIDLIVDTHWTELMYITNILEVQYF